MRIVHCRLWLFISIFLTCLLHSAAAQSLRINELLASSSSTDAAGTPLEWIELFNPGPDAVLLSDYSLTDDARVPRLWPLPPVTLAAGQYLLVYTTGYDLYNNGEYHANFRLNRDGEILSLYRDGSQLVDAVTYPLQRRDVSYGRGADPALWFYFTTPSPKLPNAAAGLLGFASVPVFSHAAGVYAGSLSLEMATSNPDETIRYTLNGSEPDNTSPVYAAPIPLNKTTPVRARAFREGCFPSDTVTHTYFFESQVPLPIVAVATDPKNLFDRRTGIYANASEHGRAWERPIALEWITPAGRPWFGVDAGIRIQGGASRDRAEKKSFRLYFRSDYGPEKLRVPVIPSTPVDEFDRLVLRANYNDSWIHWDAMERQVAVYVSDQLGRNIHGDMGAVFSHGTFVNLYLNGAYWGLYNLSERIDDQFLQTYYGFDDWDIVVDGEIRQGDSTAWNQLTQFVRNNNLADSKNYKTLQTMIDLKQMTSYYILNVYVQNHDWPHHNFFVVRERHPLGKWKFVVWDIEDSFGSGASRGDNNLNTFARARDESHSFISLLFNRLLKNPEYQEFFLQELERYFAGALSQTHLTQRLDEQLDVVRDAMMMEAARWNPRQTMTTWENAIGIARMFISVREGIVRRHVYQGLGRTVPTPSPTPNGPVSTPTPFGPTPTATPTPPPVTPTPTRLPVSPTPTPPGPVATLGDFEASLDIGGVQAKGSAVFDPASQTYTVTGSGADIWGIEDEFHFLYRQLSGDFALEARITADNLGGSDWAKALLMARASLAADAPYFAVRIRESNNQASSQWRPAPGADSGSTASDRRVDAALHGGRMRIERKGHLLRSLYFSPSQNRWVVMDEQTVVMPDPVFVGLAVTSHDDGRLAIGYFRDLKWEGLPSLIPFWLWH